jgi:two-component system, NtrC family, sensor kinase
MGPPQSIFSRYQELQSYVAWTSADQDRVVAAGQIVAPHIPVLVDDFYAEIERHPAASGVITGGRPQIDRLKQTLTNWLRELFAGAYDAAYVGRRWHIGLKHVEIGLPQVYPVAALSRLRNGMIRILRSHWRGDEAALSLVLQALNKLLDLDLAIIGDAYEIDYLKREQDLHEAQQRAVQAERLAAIGQMATGIAHESRNALQRIGASAEMLEPEVEGNATALALLARIQQSQAHLHRLLDEVRNYAAPVVLDVSACRITEAWREAWELLRAQRNEQQATLREHLETTELAIQADRFRLVQVFRNLLDNAAAACGDSAQIDIHCQSALLGSAPAIRVRVLDNGSGLNAEQRRRIFEPFYTTKPTGTGLGMAITQRLVEAHGGTICVGDDSSSGAEIVVTLPTHAHIWRQ